MTEEQIDQLVKKTKAQALDLADSYQFQAQERRLMRAFLKAEICLSVFLGQIQREPGVLLVDTPLELEWVLSYLGFERSLVDESIAHETAHWAAALEVGFSAKVGARFVKRVPMRGFRQAVTEVTIDPGFSDQAARTGLLQVIRAPGVDMSQSDRDLLP